MPAAFGRIGDVDIADIWIGLAAARNRYGWMTPTH
jgi:hypothetical protein